MTFENITQLINQLLPYRTVPQVDAYRRTNTAAISTLLNIHFPGKINHKVVTRLFEENGYPIDRTIAINMSEDARSAKTEQRIADYQQKRRASH
ncbi:MAG: hypothetical protein EON60_05200 [Alphaproteobacteria bacterium]|nr:MAG: hypothetical protein EON60_05200 [Alphaproteobacteria bacterium]